MPLLSTYNPDAPDFIVTKNNRIAYKGWSDWYRSLRYTCDPSLSELKLDDGNTEWFDPGVAYKCEIAEFVDMLNALLSAKDRYPGLIALFMSRGRLEFPASDYRRRI